MARHDDGQESGKAGAYFPVGLGGHFFLAGMGAGGQPQRPPGAVFPEGGEFLFVDGEGRYGEFKVAGGGYFDRAQGRQPFSLTPILA